MTFRSKRRVTFRFCKSLSAEGKESEELMEDDDEEEDMIVFIG